MKKIKVVQFGLGAMGKKMVETILQKESMELVGAIVHSEADHGKDLGDVLKMKKKLGIKVSAHPEELYREMRPDVLLHAAVSYVPQVWQQIKLAVQQRINVVTIAEEMGYPWVKYPEICREMNFEAKKAGVSILGSGINPGFAMDILPLMLTGICQSVDSVKVTRLIDFSPFGPAIQHNIGIGMELKSFKQGLKDGKLPLHIGLPESATMLAAGLGRSIEKILETKQPVVATKNIVRTGYKKILKGQVCGFDHRCFAYVDGKKKIILEELGRVEKNLDYKNTIEIKGKPSISQTMNVPSGNLTTTSHAVNLIPVVLKAQAGLLTMRDIVVAGCAV